MKPAALLPAILSVVVPFVAPAAANADVRLLEAILKGDRSAVRALLQSRVDVDTAQADGSTALIMAADLNDLDVAALLVRARANVNAANEYGATALFVACSNGNVAMITLLLDAKANPNAALLSGETPLMTAVDNGHIDAVRTLLEHGADVNVKESSGGQTALMWAVANRDPDMVKLLVEHRADARARSKGDFTPLLFAAQQGAVEAGRALLRAGADANESRSKDRLTALMIAAAGGSTEFSALLLENGADPNLSDANGYTALHYAALDTEAADVVQTLLGRQANPNARTTRDSRANTTSGVSLKGATPLFLAASRGNVAAARALLAGGADPFVPTDERTAPLQVATWGGDPYFRDWTDEEKKNLFEVSKLLVEAGSDVNAAGEHGWTALHGAAYKGVDAVVQFLVDHGARTEVFDNYGQTPLSIANAVITVGSKDAYYQSSRVVRKSTSDLLLKLGAKPLHESGVQVLDLFYKPQ
jgi:ankyrin repeat protein